MASEKIMYTFTDEAPMLATHAFYPIVKAFCRHANVEVELKDISLSGRVIGNFPDFLKPEQKMDDILTQLGELAQSGKANIIKLPNISASLPQLKECIKELQGQGYAVPDFPEEPKNDKEKEIKARYGKVMGSAVNPVLREGNSDRRAAIPVKEYAVRYPHKMGSWDGSKTCVRSMKDGDFYSHERSMIADEDMDCQIELRTDDGTTTVLREKWPIKKGDVIDATFMDSKLLCDFYEECIQEAKEKDILFSLHLKATMMKVSDPIMFGHCVRVYYKDLFAKYADTFAKLGVNVNNGLGDVYKKIEGHADEAAIKADIMATYAKRGKMAMVDGGKGITNLHVPSDIIIDNSMPTAIRDGGKMWNTADKTEDFLATIPDRGYGGCFDECVKFCAKNGAFDPKTMGGCPNVGLMAQKAEEYGSHPNTFEVGQAGTVRIVDKKSGRVLVGQKLAKGDIYRACQTKDAPIKDWVKLAVARCRANNFPPPNNDKPCKAIFWLDSARAHDVLLMNLVQKYLPEFKPEGLDIEVMSPNEAMRVTLERAAKGLNTITVTGNVLRDYNTDLFPILELNTSSKMLSIVPMLTGGAMYETGAGGSAPKHVQQFQKEGHLRWDSLGEYLALTCAFEDLGKNNAKAKCLAAAMDKAVGTFLIANKNPSRKVKEIDNRGSHYWLARYWADNLASQDGDKDLQRVFAKTAKELADNEAKILADLSDCQGPAVDLGGYYHVDAAKVDKVMQPSETLNNIISSLQKCVS